MADNPYYRIKLIRYRLIEAKRLVKSLELREQRAFKQLEVMIGPAKDAAEKYGMTSYEVRTLRARLTRAMHLLLLAFAVGCATKQPRRLAPVPPIPVVAHREVETASQPQAVVIGPPVVKRLKLVWNSDLPVEIYSSTNLQTWTKVSDASTNEYFFFVDKPHEFFKARAWEVEPYQVKSNGVWITRTFIKYSNWATTE